MPPRVRREDNPGPISPPPACDVAFAVLSSSSGGNCSALVVTHQGAQSLILLDLGLSPRRTHAHLAALGVAHLPISCALITHFDSDHWHPGWLSKFPSGAHLIIHKRHLGVAARVGAAYIRTQVCERDIALPAGLHAHTTLNHHDELGSVAFRVTHANGATLGYATDLGRPHGELIDTLQGVDVLAIESNYCPDLEEASDRPQVLKDRVMGGSGHLSNQQSAQLVRAIHPRSHVVLLHLSRQCNTPERALACHAHEGVSITPAHFDTPTPWFEVRAHAHDPHPVPIIPRRHTQHSLFGTGA